jgi:hypothetical protein
MWYFWRLIVEGVITYTEAIQMDDDELMTANAALDHYIDLSKKNSKK